MDDDDEVPVEYSVKKLSELDPRFVSAPGSCGSTATAAGAAGGIGSDTESLYGIPYRYGNVPNIEMIIQYSIKKEWYCDYI